MNYKPESYNLDGLREKDKEQLIFWKKTFDYLIYSTLRDMYGTDKTRYPPEIMNFAGQLRKAMSGEIFEMTAELIDSCGFQHYE